MSKGFTDGYFPLGLILGISIASVLGLLISNYGAGCYLTDGNSYGYLAEGVGPDKRCWLIPFFVYGEDSLVHWVIAILTIAAVWMLWRTLELTRGANEAAVKAAKAALVANAIMRAEQRPWLKISLEPRGQINIIEDTISAYLGFAAENIGTTPARDVPFHWQALRSNSVSPKQVTDTFLAGWSQSPAFNVGTHAIFPGDREGPTENLTFDVISESDRGSLYFVFGVTYRMKGEDWFGHTVEMHRVVESAALGFRLEIMTDGRLIN